MKKTRLKQYAMLVAKMGANVQKGQDVIVYADLDQPEFVKMVVESCYKLGARSVKVEWSYQPLAKINVKYQTLKTLSTLDDWQVERLKHYVKTIPVRIHILSEDPDGNKGINQMKLSKANQAIYPLTKPFRDQLENKYQWTIVGVPSKAWAKKVFPTLPARQAIEKLWEAIFYTARVTDNPIQSWQAHNADILKRCDYLNHLGLVTLHYQASNGTDFKVGMLENALWIGGGETSLQGIFYNPNMPTEEVFITPKKGVAEGIVYSTKPLSYRGELIDQFSIRFAQGKAVEVHAEKNEDLLKQMIAMDEGAAYLGECALVPFDSPIRNSGITFWNTLYDENAACHLALGMGFSNCIKDYEKYSKADFDAMGVNDSMIHVDFMIGSEDLTITGIDKNGKRIPIFAKGNWAF